ncbi:MAG: hypothetical protein LIO77_07465, partial [Rikenellaceae bacterium]|nr:hypothetical protein [Rikenellaceae bacterium]
MIRIFAYLSALALLLMVSFAYASRGDKDNRTVQNKSVMTKELTDLEKYVILDKGTEAPFTGEYCDFKG